MYDADQQLHRNGEESSSDAAFFRVVFIERKLSPCIIH